MAYMYARACTQSDDCMQGSIFLRAPFMGLVRVCVGGYRTSQTRIRPGLTPSMKWALDVSYKGLALRNMKRANTLI